MQRSIYDWIENTIFAGGRRGYIVEVGGHVGQDSVRLARLASEITVFEPDPRNHPAIAALKLPNVKIVTKAVSDQPGQTTMYLSGGHPDGDKSRPWHTASSSILKPTGHVKRSPCYTFDETAVVETTTLDAEIAYPLIDFLWIDAQGAEAAIFRGGQKTLAKTNWIYFEADDWAGGELYEGQKTLPELLGLLPGRWELVERYETDALCRRIA